MNGQIWRIGLECCAKPYKPDFMKTDIADQVTTVFADIDRQTQAFQLATGLNCPSGCGKCCENEHVEVTVLDCLPLAVTLFQQEQGEFWLAQFTEPSRDSCLFYQPDPEKTGNGQCRQYAGRPLLCRTFGFGTVRNKAGVPELAVCAVHRATQPETVDRSQQQIAAGLLAPNFADLAMQLAAIEPSIGHQRYPINQAMQRALALVGFERQWTLG
jgi:uncharacterized protein